MSAAAAAEAAAGIGVRALYQPIVDLRDGRVRGYEALARGPAGTALEAPLALFAEARRLGTVSELDWQCRSAAFRGALAAGLRPPLGLFVNAEPEALGVPPPPDLVDLWAEAARTLHLVVELTERQLVARPATLLHVVGQLRELGCSIALDDVGAEPASLALMPVLEPDVIKLDLLLVQGGPRGGVAATLHAVTAQAERTGATVVAEGIETEEQLATAVAFGATLGQGYWFGAPSPDLPVLSGRGHVPPVRPPAPAGPRRTPFETVAELGATRTGGATVVDVMVGYLLEQAALLASPPVVLAVLPSDPDHAGEPRGSGDLDALSALVATSAVVGALTTGARPRPGLLQGELAPADPLASEWDVVVVGAHFAGAVVSRALPGGGRDAGYLFALTHDRGTVLRVAQDLLGRLAGGEADGVTFPDLMPLDVPDAGVRSSPKRPPG